MVAYTKFQQTVEYAMEKVFDFGADTLKVLLCLTAPVNTNTVKANLTEISAGNGYTAGGTASAQSSSAQSGGTYKLVSADVVFTASGGSIGGFRYPVLYDDTPTSPADPLISFYDYGSSVTILDTETFTTDFDATNGVFQVA